MTVIDFRSSGGFEGAQPRGLSHDHTYADGHQGYQDDWQDEGWDDHRYQTEADSLVEAPTLVGRISRLTHYLGALVSVGLIVMLVVWGYKLVVRDVSGVPVIRAIEGEARTAPDNPGGELTDRIGLAVNTVAAGTEPGQVDQVAIAPSSTPLGGQDVPMGELGATAQEPSHPLDLPLVDEPSRVIARPDGEVAEEAAANAVANAVISDAPAADAPVNEAVTDLAGNEPRDIAITTALAEASAAPSAGAIAQSARPAPRPRRVAAAAPVVASDAAPAAAAVESRPAEQPQTPSAAPVKVASGAPLVQIGAFDSDALARGEWNRVSGKLSALFAGKGMVVQEHKANGRTFWRLRAAGFASRDEARRFCAALIAEGVDCIPASAK
uniref:SPOR domain-containing protein n=1 Tax=Paracoccus sp. TRP TaxID=412597 RepID=UPI000225F96A|nr:SPOR domain-containing protein [Paracoccus sp. TRP]